MFCRFYLIFNFPRFCKVPNLSNSLKKPDCSIFQITHLVWFIEKRKGNIPSYEVLGNSHEVDDQ